MPDEDVERMMRAVDELNARVASCHERVECPKCGAPVGMRCRRVQRPHYGAGPAPAGRPPGRELKHPHDERVRADGIPLR